MTGTRTGTAPAGVGIESTAATLAAAVRALDEAIEAAGASRRVALEVANGIVPGEPELTAHLAARLSRTRSRLDAVLAEMTAGDVELQAVCRTADALAARRVRDPQRDLAILRARVAPYRRMEAPAPHARAAVVEVPRRTAAVPSDPIADRRRTDARHVAAAPLPDAPARRGLGGLLGSLLRSGPSAPSSATSLAIPTEAPAPAGVTASPVSSPLEAPDPASPRPEPSSVAQDVARDPDHVQVPPQDNGAEAWITLDESADVEAEPQADAEAPAPVQVADDPAEGAPADDDQVAELIAAGVAGSGGSRATSVRRTARTVRRAALGLAILAMVAGAIAPDPTSAPGPGPGSDSTGSQTPARPGVVLGAELPTHAPRATGPASSVVSSLALRYGDVDVTPAAGSRSAAVEGITGPGASPAAGPLVVRRVQTTSRVVALTFDDGYSMAALREVMDILQDEGVTATFFVNGMYLKRDPQLWTELAAAGFPVGNHTWSHRLATSMRPSELIADLQRNARVFEQVTGVAMQPWFRPPEGIHSAASDAAAAAAGFPAIVLWDATAGDTATHPTVTGATQSATRGGPGSIVLMHVGPKVTPLALRGIIASYRDRGFTFVTVSELLALGG